MKQDVGVEETSIRTHWPTSQWEQTSWSRPRYLRSRSSNCFDVGTSLMAKERQIGSVNFDAIALFSMAQW